MTTNRIPSSYTNFTVNLISKPVKTFTEKAENLGFGRREVLTRVVSLGSSIATAFTGLADTFFGLTCALGSIATLGRSKNVNLQTFNHLQSCTRLISRPFQYLVRTLNPKNLSSQFK